MNNQAQARLSRRQWLLRLGEAAALAGFHGEIGEALAQPFRGGILPGTELPAGLYEPSTEHLTHAFRSDSDFHYIPPGAETDYVRPRHGPYHPRFFAPGEFDTVRRISALLIGDDRAGATVAAADDLAQTLAEWIDLSVASAAGIRRAAAALSAAHRELGAAVEGEDAIRELEEHHPETVCRAGLAWLEEHARAGHPRGFVDLSASAQVDLLRSIGDEQRGPGETNAGQKLFDLLKRHVIRGYYTSRAGLAELGYESNIFHAESPGCEGHG